ncbi:MAG: hypothetical protein ACXVC6_06850, partial [Bacteroidia bacterium]
MATSICCATSTGGTTFQWSYSSAQTGPYSNVANGTPSGATYSGGTTSCLTVTMTATGTYWFRCTLTNGSSVTTNSVSLTINCGTGIKTFGKTTDEDGGYSIVQANDGSLVVAGASLCYDGVGDGLIQDIDGNNNGAFTWGLRFGTTASGYRDQFSGMIKNTAGNYVVTGRFADLDVGASGQEIYVAEINSTGSATLVHSCKVNQKFPGSPASVGDVFNRWGNDLFQSSAGDYVVVGATVEEGTFAQESDFYVGRFTSSLVHSWSKKVGFGAASDGGDDEARSAVELSSGNFVVAGWTSPNTGVYRVALVNLTSAGALSWVHTLSSSKSSYANSIILASDGNLVIAGYTEEGTGGTLTYDGSASTDVYVAKINPSTGATIWQHEYGSVNVSESGNSIIETSDGNYVIAGQTIDNTAAGNYDAFFFKIKTDGSSVLWTRQIDSGKDNWSNDIIQGADGNLGSIGQRDWL